LVTDAVTPDSAPNAVLSWVMVWIWLVAVPNVMLWVRPPLT